MAKVKKAELKKMAKALNESGLLSKKIKLNQETDDLLEDFLTGMEEVDDADQLEELDEALIDYYEEVAEDEEETEADDEEEEEKPKPKKKGGKKKVAKKKTAKGKTSKSKKKKTEEEVEEKTPKKKKKGGKKTGSKKTAKKDGAKKKGGKKKAKAAPKKEKKADKNKFGHKPDSIKGIFDDCVEAGTTLGEFKKTLKEKLGIDEKKAKMQFFRRAQYFPGEADCALVCTYMPDIDETTIKIKRLKK